ncbi:MAG: hypothetical protein H7Y12_05840 [Sphingobacteriaceae bacterium]|nr:hypothetical protein [Cytophagaceae bacterium]
MKITFFLSAVLLLALGAFAQTQPAFVDIDKEKRQGYAASTDVERRTVEKAWKDKLSQYGRVDSKRDVYTVNFAKLPFLDNQARIVSQLYTTKKRTQVFLSVDQNNGEYVAAGHGQGREVEAMLVEFLKKLDFDEQVRVAEGSFSEAEKASREAVKRNERLLRDLENNKKDAERLAKKLEENKAEFTKLQADTAQNRLDRLATQQVLEKQRQGVENVKSRKPN